MTSTKIRHELNPIIVPFCITRARGQLGFATKISQTFLGFFQAERFNRISREIPGHSTGQKFLDFLGIFPGRKSLRDFLGNSIDFHGTGFPGFFGNFPSKNRIFREFHRVSSL